MNAQEAIEAMRSGKAAAVMDCNGDFWYPTTFPGEYWCTRVSRLGKPPNGFEPYRALVFADALEPHANWGSFDVKPAAPDVTPHAGIYPVELEY